MIDVVSPGHTLSQNCGLPAFCHRFNQCGSATAYTHLCSLSEMLPGSLQPTWWTASFVSGSRASHTPSRAEEVFGGTEKPQVLQQAIPGCPSTVAPDHSFSLP